MPRLTEKQWAEVHARWDKGETMETLIADYGISDTAFKKQRRKWGTRKNIDPEIAARTQEKIAERRDNMLEAAHENVIDREAERRAAVIMRHRDEWTQVIMLRQEALALRVRKDPATGKELPEGSDYRAFEKLKIAKITAEMTAIQQASERLAYGIDKKETGAKSVEIRVTRERVIVAVDDESEVYETPAIPGEASTVAH